jgi:Ankyrin repeats (3 copies)
VSAGRSILYTLLGLNRAGRILHRTLVVLIGPALLAYFVWLPRLRFSDEDERLFRAARHGDRAAIERALAAGAHVNAASPVDGKTALFRAAVFGQTDAVRVLLEHGADPAARGSDGHTAIEVVQAARGDEKDPAVARDLDSVAAVLREPERHR